MKHTRILLLIALLSVGAVGLPSLRGATFTVINTNDNGPGSLRQALADAVDGDTINFNSSLNGQTITLTSGQLLVGKSITISGPGANQLAVDANHVSRVFYIGSGKDVTISGLTITNGSPPDYYGGGIYNDHAILTLSSCTIRGNSNGAGVGGGIYNNGLAGTATLIVSNCTISGNSTVPGLGGPGTGGGIYNESGTVTITNSSLSGNSAGNDGGGGIANYGTVTITNSTLSGNSCGSLGVGGGILNHVGATVTITNSTLSGNSAPPGGGGGIFNNAILKIGNTILNAGPSGENIYNAYGTVISLGYNLSSDNGGGYLTATGDHINTDPRLGPLQDNGGPTFTHLPASNSPAIDAGDPTLGMDQRGPGFPRVRNGRIDIGAVEVQVIPTPTPTPTPTPHGHH